MKTIPVVFAGAVVACACVQPLAMAEAATFTVLHSFSGGSTDGANPAGMIDVKGTLYGTTVYGSGDGERGTVFAVDPKTGAESVVYSFCSRGRCKDGYNPQGGLADVKGTLYGLTSQDSQQYGQAFALDPDTGKERVLHAFCQEVQNCADGAYPTSLMNLNGTLYGTTQEGGTGFFYGGTVFALGKKPGTFKVIYSFCSQDKCTDGAEPGAPMINVNGTLYGTTGVGGYPPCTANDPPGCGTVFAFDPNTGVETVLYDFGEGQSADGHFPEAGLLAVNGVLYGTTGYGGGTGCFGNLGCGTVFSVDINTGTENVLYRFCSQANCTDGANPFASLVAVNGTLYGTTYAGGGTSCGGSGCGTVFSVDPNTGAQTVLYSFCSQTNCADGANPRAALIAVNGMLYGTTYAGGAYGYGTVFVLKQKR